jgi:serine/threonine protein kinase
MRRMEGNLRGKYLYTVTDSRSIWPGDLILESSNIADALDYLHKQLWIKDGIALHDDIKPENILAIYPDGYDSPACPAGK